MISQGVNYFTYDFCYLGFENLSTFFLGTRNYVFICTFYFGIYIRISSIPFIYSSKLSFWSGLLYLIYSELFVLVIFLFLKSFLVRYFLSIDLRSVFYSRWADVEIDLDEYDCTFIISLASLIIDRIFLWIKFN